MNGVKLGEQVVTSANFLIDSESQLQVALGLLTSPSTSSDRTSAAHHPEASIELTSEPSPARKGSNVFRVKLVDASGSSISGAEVSVTFFLPEYRQQASEYKDCGRYVT